MPSNIKEESTEVIQSAWTLFEIVEYVKDNDGATVTAIADDLGYAKSTVHRHLSSLAELGYLVEDSDGYHVGLRFLDLGRRAQVRVRGFKRAKDKVEQLADETGERAQFLVEEYGDAVYIHRSHGEQAIRTDPGIGSRIPLHATAAGKAILANINEPRREEIIREIDFKPITNHTITDPDELYDELETIRERGYSQNRQENLDGLHAVGVPITGPKTGVIGAISVSGPSHRFDGEWFEVELPRLLLGAANELELNITHS